MLNHYTTPPLDDKDFTKVFLNGQGFVKNCVDIIVAYIKKQAGISSLLYKIILLFVKT